MVVFNYVFVFFFLMIRRPPRSTLFPTRRSSDLRQDAGSIVERRQRRGNAAGRRSRWEERGDLLDRKSTRLNSSHPSISYAVFCLKKKKDTLNAPIPKPHKTPERIDESLTSSRQC